jgi:proteasome lid subunit RPN8/RPN11
MLQHRGFPFKAQATEIIYLADSSPDREVCGLILKSGEVVPLENMAKGGDRSPTQGDGEADPRVDNFELDLEVFEVYRDRTACIYHSHVGLEVGAQLSAADIWNAQEQQIPYLVYHTQFKQWDYYDPTALHPFPIMMGTEGPTQATYYMLWPFEYGRSDCGSLVRAWYAGMLGIDLMDHPRIPLEDKPDQFALSRFEEMGFVKITDKMLFQTHDVVCFDISGGVQNHIGVISSANYNLMLHNFGEGRYSEIVNYDKGWRDRTRYVFRHKSMEGRANADN